MILRCAAIGALTNLTSRKDAINFENSICHLLLMQELDGYCNFYIVIVVVLQVHIRLHRIGLFTVVLVAIKLEHR